MNKIPLKYKIAIVILCIVLFLAGVGIFIYVESRKVYSNMGSSKVKLDEKGYKGLVEFSSDIDFMFVVNKDNKVSNLIFVEKKAIEVLADKNIEGKSIEDATYSVIEILNNNNLLNKNVILTSYQDNDVEELLYQALNKNLVIFGSSRQISKTNGNLNEVLKRLGLASGDSDIDKVRALYDNSILLLLDKTLTNMEDNDNSNVIDDVKDIYMQLVVYARGEMEGYKLKVDNQEKNDPNGLLITDLESKSGRKADSNSWYLINNSSVIADISIDSHEFCFQGDVNNYKEGSCS